MKSASAWMPLYVGDYLADTSRLTTEQHGAYLLLLMDYWRNGPPPNDDVVLASITRLSQAAWKRHSQVLRQFFRIQDEQWIQGRAERERAKANAISGARKTAGKEGADKRWADAKKQGKPMANAIANGMANDVANEMTKASQDESQTHWQNDTQSQSQRDKENSEADASAQAPPDSDQVTGPRERMWSLGVELLGESKSTRSLLGRLAKDHGEAAVLTVLERAALDPPAEPRAWVMAACSGAARDMAERQDPLDRDTRPEWAIQAGFEDVWQAENAGCGPGNFRKFAGGRKVAA